MLRVARQAVQGETQPELQRAAALQLDGAQGLRENAESDPVGGGRHALWQDPVMRGPELTGGRLRRDRGASGCVPSAAAEGAGRGSGLCC